MYDSSEYADSRLRDTIVRQGDKPVKILSCFTNEGKIWAELFTYPGGGRRTVPLDKLDLTPVPLGFSNTSRGVAYLARIPKRLDYRQGLRFSNYTSLYGREHRSISKTSIANTIRGNYPSFKSCLDEVVNMERFSQAFSREFALLSERGSVKIIAKWGLMVGDVINKEPLLKNGFEYLQETLDEARAR